jgi:beta-alanine--pyruvate transaminase
MRYPTNDLENHWMPFTANRDFKKNPRLVVEGKGVHYTSHTGHDIMDAVSGLFCCPAGQSRQEIADAVYEQMQELAYMPSFQHGHPAAFELARRVKNLTPEDLDYVFFANSGSEAIETALKIAILYHRVRGEGQRQRLVGRERGYHGVNFGGFSIGGIVRNREMYGLGLPGVVHMRHTWLEENRFSRGQPENGAELANDLQRFCDIHGGETIAACIVEPVAGSIGCYVPPKGYLERLREICDEQGILLIFDEVITGFGRMGENFAGQRFGVTPDIMTIAKALTNGSIPMGGVVASEKVYKTITEAALETGIEFFHGYTYSAHPAACAAGIATLDIYENDGLFKKSAEMEDYFLDQLFAMRDADIVTDIRGIGLLGAFDMAPRDGTPGVRGGQAVKDFYNAGVLVKMTGDTVIVAPPFVADKADIDKMFDIIRGVVAKL